MIYTMRLIKTIKTNQIKYFQNLGPFADISYPDSFFKDHEEIFKKLKEAKRILTGTRLIKWDNYFKAETIKILGG